MRHMSDTPSNNARPDYKDPLLGLTVATYSGDYINLDETAVATVRHALALGHPEVVARNLEVIERLSALIGDCTVKTELRQTGFSLYVKFDNVVSINTAAEIAHLTERGLGNLSNALRVLLGREQVIG
jgi:hypothetical protein